ncbi:MAG: response regulator transcription factor, partial [Chloroflexi bacterium]|nr:response regulator transcription factor [Chloroflexota bacterium]
MKLLVVEDDPEIVEAISLCFELQWPEVNILSTPSGESGVYLAGSESPDIIILDLGLPDMSGFEVLRQVRLITDIPVIILTVKGDELDKIKGLGLGADDYVTKPFKRMELLARVKAVLRRTQIPKVKGDEQPFVSGVLKVDFNTREVTLDGVIIRLTPIEYNLLTYMVRHEGKMLTNRFLFEKVWGEEYVDATDYL